MDRHERRGCAIAIGDRIKMTGNSTFNGKWLFLRGGIFRKLEAKINKVERMDGWRAGGSGER